MGKQEGKKGDKTGEVALSQKDSETSAAVTSTPSVSSLETRGTSRGDIIAEVLVFFRIAPLYRLRMNSRKRDDVSIHTLSRCPVPLRDIPCTVRYYRSSFSLTIHPRVCFFRGRFSRTFTMHPQPPHLPGGLRYP